MRYDENGTEIIDNAELYRLIDAMVIDIQHLETEVVKLRRCLADHLPQESPFDFFNDLAGYYSEHSAYYEYVQNACGGIDPLGDIHAATLVKILKDRDTLVR